MVKITQLAGREKCHHVISGTDKEERKTCPKTVWIFLSYEQVNLKEGRSNTTQCLVVLSSSSTLSSLLTPFPPKTVLWCAGHILRGCLTHVATESRRVFINSSCLSFHPVMSRETTLSGAWGKLRLGFNNNTVHTLSSQKVDERDHRLWNQWVKRTPCQAVQDTQLLLVEAGSDGCVCVCVWLREKNEEAGSVELGIGSLGHRRLCDHLPRSSFLYFDVCFCFFWGNPPAKGAAKAPIYSAGVGLFYPRLVFFSILSLPSCLPHYFLAAMSAIYIHFSYISLCFLLEFASCLLGVRGQREVISFLHFSLSGHLCEIFFPSIPFLRLLAGEYYPRASCC